ncbi:MAG: transcription termination factor Rho [Rubripirellula sp.]
MAKKRTNRNRNGSGNQGNGNPNGGSGNGGGGYNGGGGNSNNGGGGGGGGNGKPRVRRRRRGGGGGGGGGNSNNGGGGGGVDREPEIANDAPLVEGEGILELHPNGYGFLRTAENNYSRERSDPFVPGTMIEKFGLRQGVYIKAMVQEARRQQGPRVREISEVEGTKPEDYPQVANFDNLTAINPEKWLHLETGQRPITNRVIDLLAPMGLGQRALIVAPPRSGKTIMLQDIASGIAANHPDVKLMVLLIDERPEEVTDMKRSIVGGEVIASSLDMDVESHVRLSQLVIDRAKRIAESGQDVFLMLDSITRLARAFNKWVGRGGRGGATMSGGLDIKAMDIPKKLFATARAFQEGGSLTIVGTCLVDTNSRMDEAIFQEFKGTGNMELVLDRKLADRRVWPSIDISQSGTRREELLHDEETYEAVTMLRRTLSSMHPCDAMEQLTKQLGRFVSNDEFIKLISGAKTSL